MTEQLDNQKDALKKKQDLNAANERRPESLQTETPWY